MVHPAKNSGLGGLGDVPIVSTIHVGKYNIYSVSIPISIHYSMVTIMFNYSYIDGIPVWKNVGNPMPSKR